MNDDAPLLASTNQVLAPAQVNKSDSSDFLLRE